jgi:hypothetical protein
MIDIDPRSIAIDYNLWVSAFNSLRIIGCRSEPVVVAGCRSRADFAPTKLTTAVNLRGIGGSWLTSRTS